MHDSYISCTVDAAKLFRRSSVKCVGWDTVKRGILRWNTLVILYARLENFVAKCLRFLWTTTIFPLRKFYIKLECCTYQFPQFTTGGINQVLLYKSYLHRNIQFSENWFIFYFIFIHCRVSNHFTWLYNSMIITVFYSVKCMLGLRRWYCNGKLYIFVSQILKTLKIILYNLKYTLLLTKIERSITGIYRCNSFGSGLVDQVCRRNK